MNWDFLRGLIINMKIQLVKQVFKIPQRKFTDGELGIEIEAEGGLVDCNAKWWDIVNDHSLRGGYEYVLKQPLSQEDAKTALNYFEYKRRLGDVTLVDSVRAAVHVHVNVQNMTVVELFNFITLYLIFEEVLTKWCGDTREGNLFCLRSCDAEFLPNYIATVLKEDKFSYFDNDDIRYAAMNLKALPTYGSLEFRTMRTPTGQYMVRDIWQWVSLLLCLRDASYEFDCPQDVVSGFSGAGYDNFLEKIFGGMSGQLSSIDGYADKLINGMRNAQDVAYCVDWGKFSKPIPINPWASFGE